MNFQIIQCYTGMVLFETKCDSRKGCVEKAIKDGAYLGGADLRDANLGGAYLGGADLRDADLRDADLRDAQSLHQQRIAPSEGAFVGWKKLQQGVIAKLVIPSDAERVSCYESRKCRASKVYVHEMYLPDGSVFRGIGIGQHDNKTTYETGKETLPDSFDPSPTVECSHGIHFFLTREEAEEY